MKKYPKVPRYDHPVIEDEFWKQDDLCLLEKMDGQNYRFFLFDESLDYYKNEIKNKENIPIDIDRYNIEDGEIIFGTKNVIRGSTSMNKSEIDEQYHRAYDKISKINKGKIEEYQKGYGPMIFYAEHMIPHSIKSYYRGENVVPSLLGFDIYCLDMDNRDDYSSHPYEEKFNGFLDISESKIIFNDIGVEFVPIIDENHNINSEEDVEEIDIPISNYSETKAEGFVVRSDKYKRKVKRTSEYFDELLKKNWGINKDEAGSGAEYIVSKTVTTPRVRKILNKVINKKKDYKKIPNMVLYDIWEEEMNEIRNLKNMNINPYEMHSIILERVKAELETVIEKANLIEDYDTNLPENIAVEDLNLDIERKTIEDDEVEEKLVEEYITKEFIFNVAKKNYDREVKRDDIEELHKLVADEFWYENYEYIMKLDEEIDNRIILREIGKKCAKTIK
jgi:hypothetical protein